jgi:DNA polymerase IV
VRSILHVDLDAFYASVEQRDDPRLRGRPVIVGGPSRRGVVCAASYEARRSGVKSAMPIGQAIRLCPAGVFVAPRMAHYGAVSRQFFDVLRRFSPLVEGLSLDEAFLDVTGEERLLGDGPAIARTIKERTRAELGLVVSVGVAPSKFVAKIASDVGKPDGLVVVGAGDDGVCRFLHPLPVGRLWGVGPVAEAELRGLGLTTIGDVARADAALLAHKLGSDGAARLRALASGLDDRPVVPERAPVSVGHEETYETDLRDRDRLGEHLLDQADRACARLRRHDLAARTVTVKVKYADHRLVTRRTTLDRPTTDGRLVGATARTLLAAVPAIESRGVRLTGVSLSTLTPRHAPGDQLSLDEPRHTRSEHLGDTLDAIHAKFGPGAIRRG